MVTGYIKKNMCSISNRNIITILTLVLSSNLLYILYNSPTVVVIIHVGIGLKRIIYVRFISIDIIIGTKFFYGVCGCYEGMKLGYDVIKVIFHFSFKSLRFFSFVSYW